jgi:hypothetical protein
VWLIVSQKFNTFWQNKIRVCLQQVFAKTTGIPILNLIRVFSDTAVTAHTRKRIAKNAPPTVAVCFRESCVFGLSCSLGEFVYETQLLHSEEE